MKIWIDIITPKDLKFFKPMADKLSKKHTILCTTRAFTEITALSKIHKFKVTIIGRYGGGTKEGKLNAAIERMELLTKKIKTFVPDLLISFCSPDACRVAYGLGIKQIGFIDGPHGNIPLRLSIPLVDKLLTPKIFQKRLFTIYGINTSNVIQYNALDSAYTIKHNTIATKLPFSKSKKNILIRMPEDYASYMPKTNYMPIIKAIINEYQSANIVILTRYKEQIVKLSKFNVGKFTAIDMKYDGKSLLEKCDVFVGSGGTMTAEACLMGVPCVTLDLFSSNILDFLTKNKLLKTADTPRNAVHIVDQLLKTSRSQNEKRAKAIVDAMEDPYDVLVKTMRIMF